MSHHDTLSQLGWQAFFQQQLDLDEYDTALPYRVLEQHRSQLILAGEAGNYTLDILPNMPEMVVGDWLLLDQQFNFVRLLQRKTCFARKAAGSQVKTQLISSNVDTAFIVSSMNDDFNLNRIERFLALVNEAQAEPVVLLSKSDQATDPQRYIDQVRSLSPLLMIEAVNCLDPLALNQLSPWLKLGHTLAVLGSSGVGKSTLVNTLLGLAVNSSEAQSTGGIREDDAKGRHTTTRRSLIVLPQNDTHQGGLILDTPGMRELQLANSEEGIHHTFADIEALSQHCRFNDCQHQDEPGCAVKQALADGELDVRRLKNYQKLLRENALNSASLAQKRANDKALGKYYKTTQGEASKLKGR